jgi:hypothetical protein
MVQLEQVVPADQTVLLDVSPPELLMVLLQGLMVFDRKNISLEATYILVQGGALEIGTEEEPFMQNATITAHGDRYDTIELPYVGSKMVSVINDYVVTVDPITGAKSTTTRVGSIDIHGAPRLRSWTKVTSYSPPSFRVLSCFR